MSKNDTIKTGEIEISSNEELNEKLSELTQDPSLNKPTDEEIQEAKEEYEKAAEELSNMTYEIGEPAQAQEFHDYIAHFVRNRFLWQKDAWMGVIKLTQELEDAEKIFKGQKDKCLLLGYQALEFTYYAFSNPGGIGLQAAKDFEVENEIFVKIATALGEKLKIAREKLKEVQFLQQKWGAMAQGFYLEVEPEVEENTPENIENQSIDKK